MTNLEKLKAIIYGVAVGDALGVPYEFNSRGKMDKNPCVDMIGNGTYHQPVGSWSDDTSMTICLLDAINYEDKTIDIDRVAANFISWKYDAKFTANNVRFDIGNTTSQAISNMRNVKGANLSKCGIIGQHNGNGALMRISPLIPLMNGKSFWKKQSMIADISSMTHRNEINIMACQFYCFVMESLWRDSTKYVAVEKAVTLFNEIFGDEDNPLFGEWKDIREAINNNTELLKQDGLANVSATGYVVDTLSASIYCLLKAENYKDAVLMAVNLGDDTDTTAAVTGSMAGLYFGFEDIPEEWISKLLNNELLNDLIIKSKI